MTQKANVDIDLKPAKDELEHKNKKQPDQDIPDRVEMKIFAKNYNMGFVKLSFTDERVSDPNVAKFTLFSNPPLHVSARPSKWTAMRPSVSDAMIGELHSEGGSGSAKVGCIAHIWNTADVRVASVNLDCAIKVKVAKSPTGTSGQP